MGLSVGAANNPPLIRQITPVGPHATEKNQKDGKSPAPTVIETLDKKGSELPKLKGFDTSFPTQSTQSAEIGRALASRLQNTQEASDQYAISKLVSITNSQDTNVQSTILSLPTTDVSSRYQIIGLIGMLYNPSVTDPNLIQGIITRLLALSINPEDIALLGGAFKAIQSKESNLSPQTINAIIQLLEEPTLQTRLPQDSRAQISDFIASLKENKQTGIQQPPIGAPAQTTSEATRSKLAALLMQIRVMTTVITDTTPPEWLMLFMAFMGIDAALGSIDSELNATIPDDIGLIVTTHANLPELWTRSHAIALVEQATASDITTAYKKLLAGHLKRIFVFVPHLDFYPTLDRELLELVIPPSVKLIKTQVFGPGLSDLVAYIAHRIFVSGINKTAGGLIEESIQKFKYWVMPQLSVISKENWFKVMRRKKPIRGHLHPILSLVDTPTCINSVGSTEEGITYIGALAQQALVSEHAYQKATITYKNNYQGALDLLDKIQTQNPNLEIEIQHADPTTAAFWGNHIGLTLI